jgi:signal-transduction protein with cAMP-binding, CBS, and nucleotidyltransferase domain
MKLEEIMVKAVIEAHPEESISEAARRMRAKSVGCLVVTVDGRIKGIITDRDLLACLEQNHDPAQCKITAHMKRPVTVLPPEEEYATAAAVIRKKRIKRVPIAKDGKLLGIVSLSDLAAVATSEVEKLQLALDCLEGLVATQADQEWEHKLISNSTETAAKKSAA